MSTNEDLLGQEELDELLQEASLGGSDVTETPKEKATLPSNTSVYRSDSVFDGDVSDLISCLFKKSCLKRDEGIRIIWNASNVFPMNPGITLKIEGQEYISLGVLHENHLIVGLKK